MAASDMDHQRTLGRRNARVVTACLAAVVGMVALSYAAVPLYDLFCRVTGYGGTTQVAGALTRAPLERTVQMRFDSNIAPGLGWRFEPVQRTQTIRIGEQGLAFYRVTNTTDRPIVGQATYNVTPYKVGEYFNKLACFCFTEQILMPGETLEMPVSYFVDAALADDRNLDDITAVTLSYTFFEVDEPSPEMQERLAAWKRNASTTIEAGH